MAESTTLDSALTLPGNTEAPPAADAAVAEVEAFFADKESAPSPPESETPAPASEELPELAEARQAAREAAAEEARREVRERAEREQAESRRRNAAAEEERRFQANYRERVAGVHKRAYDFAINQGVDHETANGFANEQAQAFNSHHADGLKLFRPQVESEVWDQFSRGFLNTAAGLLGGSKEKFLGTQDKPAQFQTLDEAIARFKELALEGHISETEAKAREKAAVLKYRRQLEAEGRINGTSSAGTAATGTPPGTGITYDQFVKLSDADAEKVPEETVRRIFAEEQARRSRAG